ncbi:uncharacterized protein LOC112050231 isoform X2 [Bicyclus anynana]|uniref:Uncharacterized protein LOC112050231 isoform X2 n=1 Tax=Bicyclus anynana TaxID=110368 RepID=A0A6J1NGX0_BICAN|nr:uncharacterized protein LOC112050231 isoform X2 [Bicyclus anynana]
MEHIRQFDWCTSQPDIYFLKEEDISHSVTEKILRNKFHNPAISSDSEEEGAVINWDEIFSKKQNIQFQKAQRLFVPCLPQHPPPYPKLSAIDGRQHYVCLKIICAENPHILPEEFVPRPRNSDHRLFEELKSKYEDEKKEFIAWAKTLWTNSHCVRALHPKPHVENVYESRFKMRANEMNSYPKSFDMAAQIPLEASSSTCEMVFDKDIKSVNISLLPQIECRPMTHKFSIIRPCNTPEPCTKHPCKFILPHEKSVSILPLTEVQRELAQFALDNNAHYIASENSLKCLIETDQTWDISVNVSDVIGPDGETTNVVVLGSEFSVYKEAVLVRTYRAFKHLLQHSLLPPSEKPKLNYKDQDDNTAEETTVEDNTNTVPESIDMAVDSDDEENLCIDEGLPDWFASDEDMSEKGQKSNSEKQETNKPIASKENEKTQGSNNTEPIKDNNDFYNCTCKDTIFERPPPRSYRRWRLRSTTTGEEHQLIVHCAHKVRDQHGEVVLEPIPEYQLELGASAQSRDKIRSLALSLSLRENASLLNVRVDGDSGEVATFESVSRDQLMAVHGDVTSDVANTLHTALSQLQGLLPGKYVLRHEPSHGANALLYAVKAGGALTLDFDCARLAELDEAKSLKTPPTLTPALLPFHKYRKILPLAFTPHQHLLPREPRKPPHRQKTPPRALQWPKRKKKNNKVQVFE